ILVLTISRIYIITIVFLLLFSLSIYLLYLHSFPTRRSSDLALYYCNILVERFCKLSQFVKYSFEKSELLYDRGKFIVSIWDRRDRFFFQSYLNSIENAFIFGDLL